MLYESEGVVLAGICSYQGTPTVSMASVLTSSHEAGTEHVLRHQRVHGAAVSVCKDRDTNMIEEGRQVASIGKTAPASHQAAPLSLVEISPSCVLIG